MKEENSDLLQALLEDKSSSSKTKEVLDIIHPLKNELSMITDDGLRNLVSILMTYADLFWEAASSNGGSGYPMDENSLGGMLKHTKRVVRAALILGNSTVISQEDLDALYSACILRCVTKPLVVLATAEESLFDPHYMISFDQWFNEVLEKEIANDRLSPAALELKENTIILILRLIHCCEGKFSPVAELIPKEPLEMLIAGANLIARDLPFVIDGLEINEDRWLDDGE